MILRSRKWTQCIHERERNVFAVGHATLGPGVLRVCDYLPRRTDASFGRVMGRDDGQMAYADTIVGDDPWHFQPRHPMIIQCQEEMGRTNVHVHLLLSGAARL
jgi:hypothetical protein